MGACQSAKKSNQKVNYYFYYKTDENPWLQGKKSEWTEFEPIKQKELKIAYTTYLKNPKEKSQYDLVSEPNFSFDFKAWNRINKETKAILPIKKEYIQIDSNIIRMKKGNLYLPLENLGFNEPLNLKDEILEKNHKIFNMGKELESKRSQYDHEKNKNKKKFIFNVIDGHDIEIFLRDDLAFYSDNYVMDLKFSEFISILKDEIITMGRLYDTKNEIEKYLEMIDMASNSYLFYHKIIEIFNHEGFLKLKINEILHNGITNFYENIKLFYVALLASLKYISLNTNKASLNLIASKEKEVKIYMVTKPVKKVMDFYEANGNKNITRIFNEFLICTKSDSYAKKSLSFDNITRPQFFWKISVPNYLLEKEPEAISFCEGVLPLPNNEEVFLRSGSVLYIDSISPMTKDDNIVLDKEKDLTNKFLVNAILRSFSFDSYFEVMKIKHGINN